jgi:hypothetical protein
MTGKKTSTALLFLTLLIFIEPVLGDINTRVVAYTGMPVVGSTENDHISSRFTINEVGNVLAYDVRGLLFNIDIETCSECGGDVRIIASIEDPAVINKILVHLDEKAATAPLPPCRAPPVTGYFD